MSFSQKLSENFGKVLERSPYTVQDPLVKLQCVTKGSNIIFGRILKNEDYSNLLYIGKILENSPGRNYLGFDAWLDTTFPHIIYITGTRGSGKSFDLGVIIEGISKLAYPSPIQNSVSSITTVVIDTQSQFWTLRYEPRPNIPANQQQIEDLARWNIAPNHLTNTRIFIPPNSTKFLGDEIEFRIRPADVTHEEWCGLLGQEVYSPQGHILGRTIESLGDINFSIQDMLEFIKDSSNWSGIADSSRDAILYKLEDYNRTDLFDPSGLQIRDLLVPGTCNILMLRDLRNEDKALVTAIVARHLFTIMGDYHNRRKVEQFFDKKSSTERLPSRVWLVIDEAHVVAPKDQISPARGALIEYVKRGRDSGLSLVLATQQPSAVDDRILSQVNISINHRLTFQSDINAAVNRIPTKCISSLKMSGSVLKDFGDMIRVVDSGQCFIGDHATSRTIMLQVRPRASAHGGYSPI